MKEYENRIALRIEENQLQKLKQLVEDGRFKNMSQAIRKALEQFLNNLESGET